MVKISAFQVLVVSLSLTKPSSGRLYEYLYDGAYSGNDSPDHERNIRFKKASDDCLEYDPVCGGDGKTYSNGCIARRNRTAVAYDGECETGNPCSSDDPCSHGSFYCKMPTGSCMMQPDEQQGMCTIRPTSCGPYEFELVCGCDDITYKSPCEAASKGVNVLFSGRCESAAESCTQDYDPVCGSDGKTHANRCIAKVNRARVLYNGKCEIGNPCTTTNPCAHGANYCQMPDGTCVNPPDLQSGTCHQKPKCSPYDHSPVCGCNGEEFSSRCDAAVKGINVLYDGRC